jgi:hypothetical protein
MMAIKGIFKGLNGLKIKKRTTVITNNHDNAF